MGCFFLHGSQPYLMRNKKIVLNMEVDMNTEEKEILQKNAEKIRKTGWKKMDAGRTRAVDYNH